ncbi:phosphoadenosine phosphosulfate reductase family protein [Hyperthermus butylicus]|uniref:Phosphoadenosine 5'-phosphosulfate reductase n=1 Tax=Hyperthermus butylicus (strain DSM 5456 / JCM 9403 / PLM1-5) TaxID=415426 RepID=A2BKK3_HYPBU|nr:phosphoadenosine phosphosulfate reductase family protein [Hyperthermus butylicus]ABM80514.1 phosphoadenosine 5'-phosphosulfate reductase [Hyperthermus butylicus DSM 5456]
MPAGGRVKGAEATRLYREIMQPIYWCDDCRMVVIGSCSWCSRDGLRRLRLSQPGDIRPAHEHDVAVIREALEYSVGRRAAQRLLPGGMVFLNKVQAIDAADEVVAGGLVIGTRIYDVYRRRWLFKPDREGAVLVVEEKLGHYAVLRRKPREGEIVEKNELLEADLPGEPGLYVAFSAPGGVYGVAKTLERGGLRVLKTWVQRRRVEKPVPAGDRSRLLEVFSERLERLEREAVEFLENRVKGLGDVMVAVSGGKDSTVAAALAVKAGLRRAYFFDTGIEFPETIETAHRVAQTLGLDMAEISAGNTFWRALRLFGPPARDYRWCCKVVKFAPLAKALKPLVKTRLVTVTGQRGYESTQRAMAGKLSPSATTGRRDLLAAPIQEWTSLDVYAYIWREKLPLNPLYEMGYERVGCYLCPTSRLAEIDVARKRHREMWQRWEDYLHRYARSRGLPRIWVDYGFWRWRFSYPSEMMHLAYRLGVNPHRMLEKLIVSHAPHSIEYSREGVCHTLHLLDVNHDPREVFDLLKTTGLRDRARLEPDGTIVVVDEEQDIVLRLRPNGVLEVCGKGLQRASPRRLAAMARKILAPAYMSGACYGCEVCVAACPTGAMKAAHKVDVGRCASCQTCTFVCPAGGKLAHHAVLSLENALAAERQSSRRGGRL